jgi:hypothetical protein
VKVDHCLADLKKLLETGGAHQQKLAEALDSENHIFKGAKGTYPVTGCPAEHIISAKTKFIKQLIQNIEDR